MTLDEFFVKISEVSKVKQPFLVEDEEIRFHFHNPTEFESNTCPVSVVANAMCGIDRYTSGKFTIAGRELGLAEYDIFQLADAADSKHHPLRARLLEACGLKEVGS